MALEEELVKKAKEYGPERAVKSLAKMYQLSVAESGERVGSSVMFHVKHSCPFMTGMGNKAKTSLITDGINMFLWIFSL